MDDEEWIDIKGYEEFYMISSTGKVWAKQREWNAGRKGGIKRTGEGKMKSLNGCSKGYLHVQLTRDGNSKHFLVHRLVAEHFIPNNRGVEQVNHIDGFKTNNAVYNLEWVTASENAIHALNTGLSKPQTGSSNSNSLLTETDVLEIRKRFENSEVTIKDLAKEYSVSKITIQDVINSVTWSHLPPVNEARLKRGRGEVEFRWVSKHQGRFRGDFTYKGKKQFCGVYDEPEEAYLQVILKRRELGIPS